MTIDIGTIPGGATADPAAALRQALFAALQDGPRGIARLRALLSQAGLSAEHQALVDLLFQGAGEQELSAEVEPEPEPDADLRGELADLREVNDTVASALGACPVCWGGDRDCEACRGRGRAGFRDPDPALFEELVLPAARRVRARRTEAPRPSIGRRR